MSRVDAAAHIIAQSALSKPDGVDGAEWAARLLDERGLLAKAPTGRGRYMVRDGHNGNKIIGYEDNRW